jgi:ABC-type polysaccharide/polyol phosphate export permease
VRDRASSQLPAGDASVALPGDLVPTGRDADRNGGAPEPAATEPRREIWFRRRVRLIPAMRELWDFRELILTLAERDLRVRYKQATLGIAWALITPLLMMVAFSVIFNRFAHVATGGVPYPLFSYMALIPWTFFSSALSTGGLSLVANQPLLNKLYCPRDVFPVAGIADAVVDALLATIVLAVLFPIEGFVPHAQTFYLPLLLLVLLIFTLGVTLAVSAVVVYMRDLRLVLPLVIQMGLFVTPVVYNSTSISKSQSFLVIYSILNPLVPVIDGIRNCVLLGQAPNWAALGAGAASSIVVLIVGFKLFKRLETGMADVA